MAIISKQLRHNFKIFNYNINYKLNTLLAYPEKMFHITNKNKINKTNEKDNKNNK